MYDEGSIATIILFAVALELMGYKKAATYGTSLTYYKNTGDGIPRMHVLVPQVIKYV